MIPVYIGDFLPHIQTDLYPIYPNIGAISRKKRLFQDEAVSVLTTPIFTFVTDPKDALYFLLPYNYYQVEQEHAYLQAFSERAQQHNKDIIIFDYSDYDRHIPIPRSIVFLISQFKKTKRSNEYIIPPLVEDLGKNKTLSFRNKREGAKPIIGFCGWAAFKTIPAYIKFYIKNYVRRLPERQGVYWRRRAINLLKASPYVETNFILRDSFSAHVRTISVDPAIARKEYVENMEQVDLALAPRGDANASMRFYEALSLGRIPLLVDTDMYLPFEDVIPYDEFIVRVDYRKLNQIGEQAANFYQGISNEQFRAMQEKARHYFETYLRPDKALFQVKKILEQKVPKT